MFVGHHFAHAGLWARFATRQSLRQRTATHQLQHGVLHVQANHGIPGDCVEHATCCHVCSTCIDHVIRGGAHSPQGTTGRQRHTFVAQRDTRQTPAVVHRTNHMGVRNSNVGEEHLVEGFAPCHLLDRAYVDSGEIHRADEVGDAVMLVRLHVGSRQQDPELCVLRTRGPDLLSIHHPFITVAHRGGSQACEITSTVGLGEQLAPECCTRQHVEEIVLLLLTCSRHQQRGSCPTDTNRIVRSPHVCTAQFIIHHQLLDGRSIDTPRSWPMRCHVSGAGKLHWTRIRIGGQPCTYGPAKCIVFAGQQRAEIPHAWRA